MIKVNRCNYCFTYFNVNCFDKFYVMYVGIFYDNCILFPFLPNFGIISRIIVKLLEKYLNNIRMID